MVNLLYVFRKLMSKESGNIQYASNLFKFVIVDKNTNKIQHIVIADDDELEARNSIKGQYPNYIVYGCICSVSNKDEYFKGQIIKITG